MRVQMTIGALGVALAGASAFGGVTITLGSSAPTYGTTLTFDEPGGPTGALPVDAFQSSHGLLLTAGDGYQYVSDVTGTPGYGWLGTGNSFLGNYGVFMNFDAPVSEFSGQFWDPSGPPSFFGGGAAVYVYSPDDHDNPIDVLSFEPAWGGIGDTWINITTDGGTVIDDIRVLGYGFQPETHMDNASWNTVPAPGAAGLIALAGLVGVRRRRD